MSLGSPCRNFVLAGFAVSLSASLCAADWPGWRGPNRDAISTEKGLLAEWPKEGLPLLWKMQGLGRGYSSIAIAGGRIFTMGDRTLKEGGEAQFVLAFDCATRKELWAARVGEPHRDGGPRGTPTVDGERVYAIGTSGDLVCLDAASGGEKWRKSFEKDFGGRMMSGWRYSESPLVDGERLVCTPGGKNAVMAALDKQTGAEVWRCALPDIGGGGQDGAGYSSIVVSEACGVRQYVQIIGRGAIGVAAKDGAFLWGYNRIANGVANITTPVVRNDLLFVSTAYGTGSALLRLVPAGGGVKAEEVYFLDADTFQNHHGGVVLVGDHIYGGHGQNAGAPMCIELATGKVAWKERAPFRGSAAVLYADGRLYFRYENGDGLTLVEASPEAYREKGRIKTDGEGGGPAWAHPVILDGKLYLRRNDFLVCYQVAPPK